jgi:protein-S-isoprenylcysteine O-methyltransferase Ste14
MENMKSNKGSVNRAHGESFAQKSTFAIGHFVIIIICAWLVFGNGLGSISKAFGKNWSLSDFNRAEILFFCAFVYWIRHVFTLFYLLARKVDWSEVIGLLGFIALFEIGLVLLGGGTFRNYSIELGYSDLVALALYVFGSYLNSASEIQRKWWKRNPEHKGHCYTEGLFGYSIHINYFGDTILFAGWSLFASNIWVMAFPLVMGLSFVFFHIPGLDSYLAEHYGEEFEIYSKRTKKFIPFIY